MRSCVVLVLVLVVQVDVYRPRLEDLPVETEVLDDRRVMLPRHAVEVLREPLERLARYDRRVVLPVGAVELLKGGRARVETAPDSPRHVTRGVPARSIFRTTRMSTDTDLYRRWLAERDDGAFGTLARRHANLVFDVAWRLGGDHHVAEDALQEALLRLATDGTDRPIHVGIRAWLARLSISKALNVRASMRARRRRERRVALDRAESGMSEVTRETKDAVEDALGRVRTQDAALLSMRYIHGMGHAELATVLGVAEATARLRVHRALKRLRKTARRNDLDPKTLAGVVALLPLRVPHSAVLETAITAAVGGTTAVTVTAAALVPCVPRALAITGMALLALSSAGVFLWFALADGRDEDRSEHVVDTEHAASADPSAESTLRGRPAPPPRRAVPVAEEDAGEDTPAKTIPTAPRELSPPPVFLRVPLRARLVLLSPDGTEHELDIATAQYRGNTWTGESLVKYADQVLVQPGEIVALATEDERAAFRTVYAPIPEPPAELVVRIPSNDYPGLDELVLEVVDARTGLPLPDAWLEWGDSDAPSARVPADRNGRIPVRIPDREAPIEQSEPTLLRFGNVERTVHAPGYFSDGDPMGTKEYIPATYLPDLETWIERGVQRVALRPLPEVLGHELRRVRIVDADGRPIEGAYVLVVDPVEKALGTAVFLQQWHRRFRRTETGGYLSLSMREVVGIQVQQDRVPIAAWVLARERWPEDGPRVLRLPPVAQAELVVEGIPEGSGTWARDPLGAKRTPADGNSFPMANDPGAGAWLDLQLSHLPMLSGDVRGDLEPPTTVMRLPLPVGRSFTLHLWMSGDAGRTWSVQADEPGPMRVVRRWEDLPESE